jgi:hypothetical protein
MDPKKKASPKPRRAIKDNHGKDCPKAAARKHRLACVSGKIYNTTCAAAGNPLKEKKVPHKKVIGKMTKLLKALMF